MSVLQPGTAPGVGGSVNDPTHCSRYGRSRFTAVLLVAPLSEANTSCISALSWPFVLLLSEELRRTQVQPARIVVLSPDNHQPTAHDGRCGPRKQMGSAQAAARDDVCHKQRCNSGMECVQVEMIVMVVAYNCCGSWVRFQSWLFTWTASRCERGEAREYGANPPTLFGVDS